LSEHATKINSKYKLINICRNLNNYAVFATRSILFVLLL